MQRYIILRFGQGLIALWLVAIIVFGISRVTGDPTGLFLGLDATLEDKARFRERLELDKPLAMQYAIYIGNALRGIWASPSDTLKQAPAGLLCKTACDAVSAEFRWP